MIHIRKVRLEELKTLQNVIIESFLVPHGHAAPKKDIDTYVAANFNLENLKLEITNPSFEYFVIEYNSKLVGFSKLICNVANENINPKNVAKLERIYLLKECFGFGLGKTLFDFNVQLAKKNNQKGMWLHVWVENHRALEFYHKMGMTSVGSYNFRVSDTHYNPNHVMYLEF